MEPQIKTNTYERGTYYYFDPQGWRKVAKEFHVEYDRLETKPTAQALQQQQQQQQQQQLVWEFDLTWYLNEMICHECEATNLQLTSSVCIGSGKFPNDIQDDSLNEL